MLIAAGPLTAGSLVILFNLGSIISLMVSPSVKEGGWVFLIRGTRSDPPRLSRVDSISLIACFIMKRGGGPFLGLETRSEPPSSSKDGEEAKSTQLLLDGEEAKSTQLRLRDEALPTDGVDIPPPSGDRKDGVPMKAMLFASKERSPPKEVERLCVAPLDEGVFSAATLLLTPELLLLVEDTEDTDLLCIALFLSAAPLPLAQLLSEHCRARLENDSLLPLPLAELRVVEKDPEETDDPDADLKL